VLPEKTPTPTKKLLLKATFLSLSKTQLPGFLEFLQFSKFCFFFLAESHRPCSADLTSTLSECSTPSKQQSRGSDRHFIS
jgi:hypothetical protein